MVVGYTSGVFDLLHKGHINYLNLCKEKCDFLYVGVDIDRIVKEKKGLSRPFQSQYVRRKQIEDLGVADFVMYKEKTTIELLEEINPSIFFAPNNKVISEEVMNYVSASKMEIGIIPYTNGVSTTLLLERAYGNWG